MSLLKSYNLNVYRGTSGRYVNGRWEEGLPDPSFSIETSWQPASGRDLEALPEGLRQSTVFKGYPEIQIQTVDQSKLQKEDIIMGPDEQTYRVIHVGDWQNILKHYKFMAIREEIIE